MRFELDRLLVLALLVTLAGCKPSGCQNDVSLEGTPAEEPDLPLIPSDATVVLYGDEVAPVLGTLDVASSKLHEDATIPKMRALWATNFGYDPFSTRAWEQWGLASTGPFALVRAETHWMVVARPDDPDKFGRFLDRRIEGGKLAGTSKTLNNFEVWEIRMTPPRGEGQILLAARKDGWLYIVPTGSLDPLTALGKSAKPWKREEFGEVLRKWTQAPVRERWANNSEVEAMREGWATKSDVVGSIRPGDFFARLDTKGQAEVLKRRIINQVGQMTLAIDVDGPSREVVVRVRSAGSATAPTFVRDLKGATGEVPRVGGLADPGVLSVVRFSVDPDKTWQLIRSGLPAEDRLEVDELFEELSTELSVDARKLLLDNLHGHFFIFVYGFQQDVLSPENPSFVPDLFQLRATREAILVPVKNTEDLKRFLDILTQLSKGKLNRQALGESMQYAWIDEGPLQWAVIVGNDHAIVVDSSAAFDKATIYERGARRLPDALEAKGVSKLMEGAHRSGAYIDLASLANLLNETGNDAGPWLAPYTSLVLTTEMGSVTSETTLELGLEEIPRPVDATEGPGGAFEPL